jgi:uncharacterized membrane protein
MQPPIFNELKLLQNLPCHPEFIHILTAIFWIGGMLFTAAVLVPASRHQLPKNKKGAFLRSSAKSLAAFPGSFSWY